MIDFPKQPPSPSADLKDPDITAQIDPRIYLDQETKSWIFEDKNAEYEYNFESKEWSKRTQATITSKRDSVAAQLDKEEEENKLNIKRIRKEKMQKLKDEITRLKNEKSAATTSKPLDSNSNEKPVSAVYVSKLPLDITKDELAQSFSKYGIISEDYNTSQPRIKMYYDNDKFKGEAVVFYHAVESVRLAIEMMDNTYIRPSSNGESRISVQPAQFDNTRSKSTEERPVLSAEKRKLLLQKKESLKKRLTQWDDDVTSNEKEKEAKIVLVKQMFREEELKSDPMLELDLKEDIQEECDKIGIGNDITKITVYDITGVVTIKFKNPISSSTCISNFNGRFFDGLKLQASFYRGEKLEKSNPDKENPGDDSERLASFTKETAKVNL
ncbi:predicted protein [Scheffersomyces stipitis CBS 6054]|uniref:RRM domain-containing protein n=1 Tax=Scheffersomyces stipitis (strain ATCC 58785 / CBS 6054 / NBRC 10063 / NRRL Y-11545) TaxID=322104 RepID=A3LRG3_PICST|nr:predicted protein [Scheffersomyces stipitis CBS 6054]ABN65379.2 predicted protein [Scheffersomyces stipitis CBS 6054]KAG2734082.1 hypothetical protein G9P44_003607 [Scheffersomyces stipitis]